MSIVVSYQASILWGTKAQPETALTPQAVAGIAEPQRHPQLDTASTQEELKAEPIVAAIKKITEPMEDTLDIPLVPRAEPVDRYRHLKPTNLPQSCRWTRRLTIMLNSKFKLYATHNFTTDG